jgi:GntR family transcriptional regulator
MWIQIDPLGAEPLFRQICSGVKGAVARGRLAAGERLPSVRELAQELAINPNTVAKAYAELEHEGVIVRRQGAGCFVRGGQSGLSEEHRRRELARLAERLAVEAFHLGLGGGAVRAALDAALEQLPAGMAQAAPAPEAQKDPNEPDTDRSQPRSFDSPDATRRAS